ncbi:MAG: DUF3150 domain-containing protein [Proteobacteria bacterium]|nr:DUF3150 domain-containing protein [Pseudomonadota bacterium]
MSQMQDGIIHLTENLVVIEARIRTISGVTSEGTEESDAFTSRGVRYVAKKELAPPYQFRQETIRECRGIATRFLSSGWAAPEARSTELLKALGSVGKRVILFRDTLADNWPKLLADWAKKHPEVKAYEDRFPGADDVRARIGLSVATYAISPRPIEVEGIEDGIAGELADFPRRILAEIAQDVRDAWTPTATSATQKIRKVLARVKGKCATLAFLGGHIGYVAGIVENAIDALPATGKIEGQDFIMLSGLLAMLSDPKKVEETATMYPDFDAEEIFGSKSTTGDLFEKGSEAEAVPAVSGALLNVDVSHEAALSW